MDQPGLQYKSFTEYWMECGMVLSAVIRWHWALFFVQMIHEMLEVYV